MNKCDIQSWLFTYKLFWRRVGVLRESGCNFVTNVRIKISVHSMRDYAVSVSRTRVSVGNIWEGVITTPRLCITLNWCDIHIHDISHYKLCWKDVDVVREIGYHFYYHQENLNKHTQHNWLCCTHKLGELESVYTICRKEW